MKLDVLPSGRSFDFIGRVEHLQEDMDTLLRSLRVNRTSSRSAINPSTHARDTCGRQVAVPLPARQAALPVLCELLRADFICFGYPLPTECASTAGISSAASSPVSVS